MNKPHKWLKYLLFVCFAGLAVFLTLNRHSRAGSFNYHSEIWSDKAGYYVYLPAALKFGFDPKNFPDSIDTKTGYGFKLDRENGKIHTKYTYGVALLQLPFFLIADAFSSMLGQQPQGFSPLHHLSVDLASVFYLILGLFFLHKYLKSHFKSFASYSVLLSLFFGTNLYYYSIDETGMSHIYSFFLFCAYLNLLLASRYLSQSTLFKNIAFGIIAGLIILIRPTNIVFLATYFFLDLTAKEDIWQRFKRLLQLKNALPILLSVFIVFLPQFSYWKYTNGHFLSYSYGKESFNWAHPQLIETWFSPKNGLFLNTPFFILIIICFYLMKDWLKSGIFFLGLFLIISFIYSCWWDRTFGCAFGARSYVEYYAFFSIPVAYVFKEFISTSKIRIAGFYFVMAVFIFLNLKMTYSYDGCFPGSGDWDWSSYFRLIFSAPK